MVNILACICLFLLTILLFACVIFAGFGIAFVIMDIIKEDKHR